MHNNPIYQYLFCISRHLMQGRDNSFPYMRKHVTTRENIGWCFKIMSKTGDVHQTTVQIYSLSLDILFNNILMYRSIQKHTHRGIMTCKFYSLTFFKIFRKWQQLIRVETKDNVPRATGIGNINNTKAKKAIIQAFSVAGCRKPGRPSLERGSMCVATGLRVAAWFSSAFFTCEMESQRMASSQSY